ncbi:Cytosolic phospholipase A2 delta [Ophiophagus hannah]|uniref:Phospholipase A2 n=1 Tax=Ophiophagus hannah TaxID=8665 RepID=V8NR21_OPHHA|nr:Cytosolic phospholipase A2 delta [Ophiophagus hannah]
MEFTPFEVGLLKYGAYIRAEDYGSKFFMGRIMKKIPESHICFLKGAFKIFTYTVLDTFPNQLMTSLEYLSLADTAAFIDTSYATLMKPERKVDVIIHLNYSSGSQTAPLEKASRYFAKQGIPFPKIDLSREKNLKECYVFEDATDSEAPIVVFFPLINDTFKKYKAPGKFPVCLTDLTIFHHLQMKTFPCNLLTVRVIRLRNLRQADALSHSDCYVTLCLPTATTEKLKTKTVNNCKNPVWNETFYYRIQRQVKNVLEFSVYDSDAVTEDDHLFTINFDVARLPDNEKTQEELEVEFIVEPAEGNWFNDDDDDDDDCREICTLEAEVDQSKQHKSQKDLSLSIKGSCEGTQTFKLGSDAVLTPPCPTTFHYIKYKDPSLNVKLPKTKPHYNPEDVPIVKLNSLPMGEKVPIVEEKKYNLHVKVNDCNCSCPGDLDVRLGYDLCSQEQEFLCKRKRIVAQALKQVLQLDYDLQDHEVPVVAIMTTGGGTRSYTTTFGSMRALKKLNLMDCVTYMSGLSGTSWAMAHLYRDAYWSQNDLHEKIQEAKKQVTKSKLEMFTANRMKYYYQQLNQRKQEGYPITFIDLWGLVIEYLLNDGKDNHRLSEQKESLINGQNPLPIYVTINIKDKYSTQDFKEWLEFTPYEVGFLKYGAFVHPEDFGSEFFMGHLIKKLPETRLCYLHGDVINYLIEISKYYYSVPHGWVSDLILDLRTVNTILADVEKYLSYPLCFVADEDPHLPTKPYELKSRMFVPPGNLATKLRGVLTDRLAVAQYHNFLKGFQMHDCYMENTHFHRWKATTLDCCPNQLTEYDDHLGLVDAGFFINTSCPPLLRLERKVDVILHLSYSAGSQTLPLEDACKYYREQGIPFPNVVLTDEDRKHLKECYYFNQSERSGCPILVFFPLVNDSFQYYSAPGERRSESDMAGGNIDVSTCKTPYSTYCLKYSDEDFDKLVNLISHPDCYWKLQLPTASPAQYQTKTIHNCKDPVWNETFHFMVQSKVKNVLELSVHDDDVYQDDHLFTVRFDIAKLPLNEKVLMNFNCNQKENEELELEFELLHSKTNLDLRLGYDLCSQEQDFLHKRKNIVTGALKKVLKLEKDLQDHEVPIVAIMTTGGSMRSLTACFGSLRGLQKLNLLDCATYMSGLSGTTWTMAKLYKDAHWSRKNLDEQINEAKRHVTKSKLNGFSMERLKYYNRQLRHRKEEGQKTSCIDLWGLFIEYMLNDGKDSHKLSDQQQAVNEGQNPFPIYTAINVKEKYSTMDFKEWIEFTPYEVGILKYGAFVRTEDFGSEFFMGHLMKRLPETRISYLQDEEPDLTIDPHLYNPPGPLSCAFRDVLTDRLSVAQYHNFIKGLQLNNSYLENENFCRWKDTLLDSASPNQLTQTEEYLSLEDTGFFINTSSAPLLRPERKVDVILHLNYSAGSQSRPLEQSCNYYADQGIPFPKAVLKDDDKHLKECYLFEDAENPAAPILLFFPQVNDTFRYYKAPGVKRSESEMKDGEVDISSNSTPYSTYSMTFTEEEYDQLIELSEYNVLNNQHLILQALDRAVERKKNP